MREAAVRELREETGLRARCGDLVGWAERITGDVHYVILDFRVELLDPPGAAVAGDDAVALAWVPLGEVGGHDLVPGMAEFLVEHGVIRPDDGPTRGGVRSGGAQQERTPGGASANRVTSSQTSHPSSPSC